MTAVAAYLAGEWVQLDGAYLEPLPAYPNLPDAALVVSDFGEDALSGVLELEGNPVHAPVLINRRLTSEGATDGESRVLVHALERSRHGYMACYSAIAPSRWKRLGDWSQGQGRVCLVVPLMSLLWRRIGPTRGLAARCGRNLVFLARIEKRIVHCATLAFSESAADLEAAVRSLGERVKAELAATSATPEGFAVEWQTVFARQADELSGSHDLAAIFFAESGLSGMVAPFQAFQLQTYSVETSLSTLLDGRSFLASVNPLAQKASWALERWAPWWSIAFLLIALLSTLYAGVLWTHARRVSVEADQIQSEVRDLQLKASSVEPHTSVPTRYEDWSRQILAQYATLQRFDVNRIVGTVASAAQVSGVRVLRIYTASVAHEDHSRRPGQTGGADRPNEQDKAVVIDGAFPAGGEGSNVGKLAKFVEILRANGFNAVPIDTVAGHVDGNLLAQVFSYRLTAVRNAKEG